MPKTVLIVDDEPGLQAALTIRLEAAGYQILRAAGGREGLARANEQRPDAILLDIRMPDIDGIEVCRRLRADANLRHIPIIFLSANNQDIARAQARDAGGDAFLSKPYEAHDVLRVIDETMEMSEKTPVKEA